MSRNDAMHSKKNGIRLHFSRRIDQSKRQLQDGRSGTDGRHKEARCEVMARW